MKHQRFVVMTIVLASCTPTAPTLEYASKNAVSLHYSAYDSVPTLTAQALDMATNHCAKFNKFANYKGGNAVNSLSSEEIHQFACEETKANDSAVIGGQSQRTTNIFID